MASSIRALASMLPPLSPVSELVDGLARGRARCSDIPLAVLGAGLMSVVLRLGVAAGQLGVGVTPECLDVLAVLGAGPALNVGFERDHHVFQVLGAECVPAVAGSGYALYEVVGAHRSSSPF